MDVQLKQRGRAGIEFLVSVQKASRALEARADEELARSPGGDALPEDFGARAALLARLARGSRSWRALRLLREWAYRNHGALAVAAFEEVRTEVEPQLRAADAGPAQLREKPGFTAPDYWQGVDFHRTVPGWDGHEYMGFIHSELILRRMVADSRTERIYESRRRVLEELPPLAAPARLLDLGCGTGTFTAAIAGRWPEAQLVACDVSLRALEQARRHANLAGQSWTLWRAPAEDTGLEAASFDAVLSYALFHELPARASARVLHEALRLLRPGGALLVADVPPYAFLDRFSAWKQDAEAAYGADPYWREYATSDLGALACAAGFAEVSWRAWGPLRYGLLTARRP